MDQQPEKQWRIGPILLSKGTTPREVWTFLVVVGLMQVMVSFSALMQPYILTEILLIPRGQQGSIAGSLAAVQQTMVLLFIWVAGTFADKFGRKAMLLFAVCGYIVTSVLYPLVTSVAALFVVRAMFGLSQNGHTAGGPTKMFDYPDNSSRGKFMALVMIFMNLTTVILVGGVASRVPVWLKTAGFNPADAGKYAMWILAAVGVVTALVCAFGLQDDRKPKAEAVAGEPKKGLKDFFAGFGEVYRYALVHPGFALLMITGFVIRTDVTVIQSFLAQWVVTAGATQGLPTAQATKVAGQLLAMLSIASFIVPPIFGVLLDRVNRQLLYGCSMGFAGLALISTALITNVSTWPIYVVIGIIGLAESAQTITQQALFGQEAPAHLRGTAYGVFAFTGTFSVVIIAYISGRLFDSVGYTAPFVMSGLLHLVFLGFALMFMQRQRTLRKKAQAAS